MTFRRQIGAFVATFALTTGAHTSSLVSLPPLASPDAAPSIVSRGEARTSFVAAAMPAEFARQPSPDRTAIIVSRSILAIGIDALQLLDGHAVADARPHRARPPVVIRGGEVGSAHVPAVEAALPQATPSAPAASPAGGPRRAAPQPRPEQRAPATAQPAPAAPQPLPPTAIPM